MNTAPKIGSAIVRLIPGRAAPGVHVAARHGAVHVELSRETGTISAELEPLAALALANAIATAAELAMAQSAGPATVGSA